MGRHRRGNRADTEGDIVPLSPGSQIAGYRVISLLGSGGMGEVYLVENPHLLRREALKVISLAGAHDPDFQKRFTNEARTTAALDHPSIISIHQYGINEDGTPWFTMNYLEGTDLASGPISPSDVVEVTTKVADALDYAHRHQIVHRDVKPANIIVTRDPGTKEVERVTVLDFGIAKLVNSTSLTATSAFIGTLAYCAPEVIEGHDATATSDQYSLACTVFQLLTGQAPFTTTTPSALVMAHLTKPIAPVSSHRPELAAFDPVLAKALAKNPADRYPNCRAFAAALRQALDGRSMPSAPTIGTPVPPPSTPGHLAPPSHPSAPGHPSTPGQPSTPYPSYGGTPGFPVGATPPPSQPYPYAGVGPTRPVSQPTPGPSQPSPYGQQSFPGPTSSPTAGAVGSPPTYPPAQPNHLVGGGFTPGGAPQRKKRTGLIVGSIAAVIVLLVAAGVGIAFATGAFGGGDEPAAPTVQANMVSSYANTSCGISNGVVYCWGDGTYGQLGNGSTTDSTSPVKVTMPTGTATAVDVGGYLDRNGDQRATACAVIDAEAYCWGANYFGQVGNGSTDDVNTPTKVPNLTNVTAVATGYAASCAISDGKVYCWGDNSDGQIGVDGAGEKVATPTEVTGMTGTATAIATAQGTTCAIADGVVYCWGNNDNGQLGTGSTSRSATPAKVMLTGATAITIGSYRYDSDNSDYTTVCAIADAKGYCWGDNRYGQVGDGSTEQRQTPAEIRGVTKPEAITVSWGSTCAITDGRLYCWGDNAKRQLGTGSDSATTTPTQVSGLSGSVTAAGTGLGTTCAQVDSTDLYCWGRNTEGQVGNGTTTDPVSTPTKLTIPA